MTRERKGGKLVTALACILVALLCPLPVLRAQEAEWTFTTLDNFEDTSPWIKGDPNSDLTQKDAAVVPSNKFVHEGAQSIAFMIHVNWTPREGEKYPQGWPMMSRNFDPPQDWSDYDAVAFWLYTDTQITIPSDRVLRCRPTVPYEGGPDWYTIPGIEAGKWQQVFVPLEAGYDWSRVTGFSFYVAEAWYKDGDRIDFYIDDMRLARRNWPMFESVSVSARVLPRGQGAQLDVRLAGRPADSSLRCTVTGPDGAIEHEEIMPLRDRRTVLQVAAGLTPGGHLARLELMQGGQVRDTAEQYFVSLQPGKRTYLSLITFYTPALVNLDPEQQQQLRVLNDSAYAGVAMPLVGSYYTGPIPDFEDLIPRMALAAGTLDLDIWPWVALNRMIGSPKHSQGHPARPAAAVEYFQRIPILDLDNETGARADFLKLFRIAARAARRWGSPGLVIDPEAYNNYLAYRVSYVAQQRGESVAQTIAKCEALGADMARIVEEEYPECIVWTLFTRLDENFAKPGDSGRIYTTPAYIIKGFLDYAQHHRVPCKCLCGGEVALGYYNRNPEALRAKIAQRDAKMAWALQTWPEHLFLAGTISPYHDHTLLTGWIKNSAGDDPELKTIEDFRSMFRTLFDAYDWVWVYAASAARAGPYDPQNNARYSAVYRAALDEAAGQ